MLKRLSKFILGGIGFFSAFAAIKELFPDGIIKGNEYRNIDTVFSLSICMFAFILFYIIFSIIINNFTKIVDKMESYLNERKYTSYEFLLGCIGFVMGLIIANLLCIPILLIKFIGIPITIIANIMFAYMGFSLILRFKNDKLFVKLRQKYEDDSKEKNNSKIIDTSAIIDGRIFDILLTRFVEGKIYVPQYVVNELGLLADSQDNSKRAKGRRGLDLLNTMQKEFQGDLIIKNGRFDSSRGVDELLIEEAASKKLTIITNDLNLNKIAKLKDINVLNINELAGALKPLANVGDEIIITITKQGKERMQGIGYLESGTMVVVENTKNKVGQTVNAVVTSVIQTQAGRMIFANLSID